MSFVYVLFCIVSDGGPVIVLTTHSGRPVLVYLSSVLVHSLLLPLQASDPISIHRLLLQYNFENESKSGDIKNEYLHRCST